MARKKKTALERMEYKFYISVKPYSHFKYENEFGFMFPVDATTAFVYEDSQTVFKLKNGDFMINAADGSEHIYNSLCEAKKELWNEVLNLEML